MVYKDPGRYIPIIYLLYSWGSQFGVPSLGFPVWGSFIPVAGPAGDTALRSSNAAISPLGSFLTTHSGLGFRV